jgi:Kef-type K+ transport system membrane component KefB/Trk K+ transport system NAD-binding subunit
MSHHFVPLLLVVMLAFFVPLILSKFRRVPVVVGEIMAGILVGRSVLGWVGIGEPTLGLLAEIGFAFLMFLSGLEIDFSILFASSSRRGARSVRPLSLGLISFGVTVSLAILAGIGMARVGLVRDPWMMALILSTTSLGIVVPVLKERQLSGGVFGQTLLLSALLADFLTMFLITIYVAVRSMGLSLDILLIAALFVPMIIIYQLGVQHLHKPNIRRLIEGLADSTAQIKVRAAFALMVAFVVLAELVGAELILGAFLAGALASMLSTPRDEELRSKLDAIGFGFFVPLFFIYVGVQFDLQAFLAAPSAWLLLPALLAAAFLIKIISTIVFRVAFSWRETLAGGLLLSARLSLIIAASAVGLRLGVISQATNAAIILVAAISATLAPYVFNLLMHDHIEKQNRLMIIAGTGGLALQVGRDLQLHGEKVCFLEPESDAAEHLRRQGLSVAHGTGGVNACLDSLPPGRVEAFLALGEDDRANLAACRSARSRGIEHLVALIVDPIFLPEFRALGVQTLTPSLHRGALLGLMARNPGMFTLLTSTQDERDVREIALSNEQVVGKRLNELHLPEGLLVLAIRRQDALIVPHGTTKIARGDRLTLIGDLDGLGIAQEWLER